jgi:hypothetical protein
MPVERAGKGHLAGEMPFAHRGLQVLGGCTYRLPPEPERPHPSRTRSPPRRCYRLCSLRPKSQGLAEEKQWISHAVTARSYKRLLWLTYRSFEKAA